MKILLIDDDKNVYNLLKAYTQANEELLFLAELGSVLETLQNHQIDVVLFDIHIGEENGLKFFSEHREFFQLKHIPVYFLSQVQELKSKLEAFQFGAHDFIVKPFEPLEVMARIRSRVQNHARAKYERKGDLLFDLHANSVFLNHNDVKTQIELSSTEYKLLRFLLKHEGQVFSRQHLLENVWSGNLEVMDRTVDQHISKLRKKIKSDYYQIKTNFNTGYSICSSDPAGAHHED